MLFRWSVSCTNSALSTELIIVLACKLLFIAQKIGTRSLAPHIDALTKNTTNMPSVLLSSGVASEASHTNMTSYSTFVAGRHSISRATLNQAESQVRCEDIVNLQFTSGKQRRRQLPVAEFDNDRNYWGSQSSHVESQVSMPNLLISGNAPVANH